MPSRLATSVPLNKHHPLLPPTGLPFQVGLTIQTSSTLPTKADLSGARSKCSQLTVYWRTYQFARVIKTKFHRLGGLNNIHFSQCSKPESPITIPTNSVPGKASILPFFYAYGGGGGGEGGGRERRREERGEGEMEKRKREGEREGREGEGEQAPPSWSHLTLTASSEAPSPIHLCLGLGLNIRIGVWTTTFSPSQRGYSQFKHTTL